jgi:hypothetical protein
VDAPASCHVDASLTAFAASDAAGAGCAACVQTMCQSDIEACSSSCTCIGLFTCLADAGVSATSLTGNSAALMNCLPAGLTSAGALLNDPGIQGVYNCFSNTCGTQCANLLPTDGGIDGGATTEAGGSTDGGGTTTTTDAGDGG